MSSASSTTATSLAGSLNATDTSASGIQSPRSPFIFGLAGTELSVEETAFFSSARPLGFILFQRNCKEPGQIRALTKALRALPGCAAAPILVDQEGGKVQRLGPPHFPSRPSAERFGKAYPRDSTQALWACRLNARLIAADLNQAGIDVDCAPVADLLIEGAHSVIGERSFGADPTLVAALATAAIEGFIAGGVIPVIKHLPGHGRATIDSHVDCPVVDTERDVLNQSDFAVFKAIQRPDIWGMTAHIVYSKIDAIRPATLSPTVIGEIIRGEIGFQGLLISDDLAMDALRGNLASRAAAALDAGCDIALHCSGQLDEMREIAALGRVISSAATDRLAASRAATRNGEMLDAKARTEMTAWLATSESDLRS